MIEPRYRPDAPLVCGLITKHASVTSKKSLLVKLAGVKMRALCHIGRVVFDHQGRDFFDIQAT